MRSWSLAPAIAVACVSPGPPPGAVAADASAPTTPASFLKGQLHLHSNNSGDSETPPEEVAQWYAEHGYDFIVFTDHNRVTTGIEHAGLAVFPGVELTINVERCDPPPRGPLCPLHVNALFLERDTAPESVPADRKRTTLYRHGIATARALGGLAQLNHPNFHWAADAATIEAVADGPLLLEVANEAIDSNNDGGGEGPSTFEIWDTLLTRGVRVWGTATDDAHHYRDAERVRARGELAFEGDRGWVMVRAQGGASMAELREAMTRGDFYATTGVRFDDVVCSAGTLEVVVADPDLTLVCVSGTARRVAVSRSPGHVVCEIGDAGYVRLEARARSGVRGWTQPCFADAPDQASTTAATAATAKPSATSD